MSTESNTQAAGKPASAYSPASYQPLTFHDVRQDFLEGKDTPSAYLERCLAVIAQREPTVRAWAVLNEAGAREQAQASSRRYQAGNPLSSIDGMPIGIKDLIETKDMPTQMGCEAFKGNFPKRDSALVRALRDAGAIVLGKTVTTALGFLDPGPTTNPFDPLRTPGGSSSGSGAAVGAKMVPVAIGTQLVGSVLRPAGYCANWAIKPTFGALNRGERLGFSQSHIGVHAGAFIDMWNVAMEIVQRAGGDPGHPGLSGTLAAPASTKPKRLIFMETEGWNRLDADSREVFNRLLARLRQEGVSIATRKDTPAVEDFEQSIASATALCLRLTAWEQRWSLENLVEQYPDALGPALMDQLHIARGQTLENYRASLAERAAARDKQAALRETGEAFISLSSVGPAPFIEEANQTPFPTGDVAFACVSSLLGAPAITVPLLCVDGMPLGVQLMGQPNQDASLAGMARWLAENAGGGRFFS